MILKVLGPSILWIPLHQAVEQLAIEKIQNLLDQIRTLNPALAEAIKNKVGNFEYNEILELLE